MSTITNSIGSFDATVKNLENQQPTGYNKKSTNPSGGIRDLNGDGIIDEVERWATGELEAWLDLNAGQLETEATSEDWAQLLNWINYVRQSTGAHDWTPLEDRGIRTPGTGPTGVPVPGTEENPGEFVLNDPENHLILGNNTKPGTFHIFGGTVIDILPLSVEATYELTELENPSETVLKIVARDRATGREWVILKHDPEDADFPVTINATNPSQVQAVGEVEPPFVEVKEYRERPETLPGGSPMQRQSDIPGEEVAENHYQYVVPYGQRARVNPLGNGQAQDGEDPITETHDYYGDIAVVLGPDRKGHIENQIVNEDGSIEAGVTITVTNLLDGSVDIIHVRNGDVLLQGREEWFSFEGATEPGEIPENFEDLVSFEEEDSRSGNGPVNPGAGDTQPDRTDGLEYYYETYDDVTVTVDYDEDDTQYHHVYADGTVILKAQTNMEEVYVTEAGPDFYRVMFTNAEGHQVEFLVYNADTILIDAPTGNIDGDVDNNVIQIAGEENPGGGRPTIDDFPYETGAMINSIEELIGPMDGDMASRVASIFSALDQGIRTGNWDQVTDVIGSIEPQFFNDAFRALVFFLWHIFGSPATFNNFWDAIPGQVRDEMIARARAQGNELNEKFGHQFSDNAGERNQTTADAIAMVQNTLSEDDYGLDFDSPNPDETDLGDEGDTDE